MTLTIGGQHNPVREIGLSRLVSSAARRQESQKLTCQCVARLSCLVSRTSFRPVPQGPARYKALREVSRLVSSHACASVVAPSRKDSDRQNIPDYQLPIAAVILVCGPSYTPGENRPAAYCQHGDRVQRTCHRIRTFWTMTTSEIRIPELVITGCVGKRSPPLVANSLLFPFSL